MPFIFRRAKLDEAWPELGAFASMAVITLFGSKLVTLFGLTTNIGNVLYAGVVYFNALNYEAHGRHKARATYASVALAVTIFFVYVQLVALRAPSAEHSTISVAIDEIAAGSRTAFVASISAYLVAQYLFIDWYGRMKGPCWRRYVVAGGAAQLVDTVMFFAVLLASAGIMLTAESIVAGLALKAAFGVLSIPFLLVLCRHNHAREGGMTTTDKEPETEAKKAESDEAIVGSVVQLALKKPWLIALVIFMSGGSVSEFATKIGIIPERSERAVTDTVGVVSNAAERLKALEEQAVAAKEAHEADALALKISVAYAIRTQDTSFLLAGTPVAAGAAIPSPALVRNLRRRGEPRGADQQ